MTSATSAAMLVVVVVIYFLPTGVAYSRKHRNGGAIALVNFFFGWTVLGWLAALIWANTSNTSAGDASPDTHVKCPDCAELVLHDAKVCKHCGCRLVPQ